MSIYEYIYTHIYKGTDIHTHTHTHLCLSELSHVQLFVTPWTALCQALLSMEFSRQEYCGGLPFPLQEVPPDPGTELASLASPALAG